MKLLDLWPSNARVNECIKTEAETLSDAVFTAVHQPVTFTQRALSGAQKSITKSEGALLKAFTSDTNTESGHLIFPIIGSSGVGKSHVIRWLDAQLQASNSHQKWHIIRIPKSASFRKALDLILAGLDGKDAKRLSFKLNLSQDQLSSFEATVILTGKLEVACTQWREELEDKLKQPYATSEEKENDLKVCSHLKLIPAFIKDECTGNHLRKKALGAIAARAIEGANNPEEIRTQFVPADFDLSALDKSLSEAGAMARNYAKLLNTEGKREECSEIINRMIDNAVRELFNLQRGSLQDLFLEIRSLLAKREKELVLLIEDFASMTGVQAELIEGIIATDGDLCTVRAALAVTSGYEGYLKRDTVRTRAKHEWLIEDTPFIDDQTTHRHIQNLVGAYLNAARVGKTALEAKYSESTGTGLLPTKYLTMKQKIWLPLFAHLNADTAFSRLMSMRLRNWLRKSFCKVEELFFIRAPSLTK